MIVDLNSDKNPCADEAWMHAACLSIAEGCPGWDNEFPEGSPAMLAVQKLRRNYLDALDTIKQLSNIGD